MIGKLLRGLLLAALAGLAWVAWQPPAPDGPPDAPAAASRAIEPPATPHPAPSDPRLWRVVTRRIVWPDAAKTLAQRLRDAGLNPSVIQRREDVTLHAFDDATLYRDHAKAMSALKAWRKRHMDATLIKARVEPGKEVWLIGLGRFYLTEYAEQMQERLRRIGKPYRYERRTVRIPTWRFAFAPMPRDQAEALWRRLQDMGVAAPVLMPEKEFEKSFGGAAGPNQPAAPISSAKRSNK